MVHIEFSDDQEKPREQLKHPQGMTGPQPQPYVPPPESNLVVGGNTFPTSSGAA